MWNKEIYKETSERWGKQYAILKVNHCKNYWEVVMHHFYYTSSFVGKLNGLSIIYITNSYASWSQLYMKCGQSLTWHSNNDNSCCDMQNKETRY